MIDRERSKVNYSLNDPFPVKNGMVTHDTCYNNKKPLWEKPKAVKNPV
jgi:hypothetical protein